MNAPRDILVFLAFVACASPAWGQMAVPQATGGVTQGAVPVPDFSHTWNHMSLNGLEPPRSGPGPVTNRSRLRTGPEAGVSSSIQLVGDYTNPILQPWAAEVVRRFGEISLAGKGYPTPRNQCWPEQVPFVLGNYGMQILQRPDKVTVLYPFDHQFRQVRLNEAHRQHLPPSWYGDSVGHYEGDTLLVDTVGVKVGRFSMVDWFGTPFTEALHIVERYRLIDYEATKEAIAWDAKEHRQYPNPDNGSPFDPSYKGQGLQIHVTIEDTGAFTMPWTATVTLRRAFDERLELVCAENTKWYPEMEAAIPMALAPDF